MKLGLCAPPDLTEPARQAGWAFVELNVQTVLKGQTPDGEYDPPAALTGAALPTPAANSLVPGSLPIVGPEVDLGALTRYMTNVLTRADRLHIRTLVFGSGAARKVPEGFDRHKARGQILAFLQMAAPIAQARNITLVIEPLNRGECNIINSVGEAMEYVKELNHPAVQCLVDSYHFWLEDEPLSNLEKAMPWIRHVHVADKVGRVAPGLSGQSDYVPFFKVLKGGGYDGLISFEGKSIDDFAAKSPDVIRYTLDKWERA